MRLRAGTAALLATLTATCSSPLSAPDDAATFTSTGVRCTIVGTAGADELNGTYKRDVICGRGGNDTISGRRGRDLVDGGAGSDTLTGGYRADTALGGPGADRILGNDGQDRLYGGPGGDTVLGGGSADLLAGEDGDDDLVGGPGADDVRGGAGTNWCTIVRGDVRTGCVPDREPATFGGARLSDDVVDVTSSSHQIVVQMHLTDDTGVRAVEARLYSADGTSSIALARSVASRESGTVRGGEFQITGAVPRYSPPGIFHLEVLVSDRVGHESRHTYPAQTLTVRDRNPDTQPPDLVALIRPTPNTTFDVRKASQDVVVKAHVTDDLSGVLAVHFCLLEPQNGGWATRPCPAARLVSGTRRDGVWRAVATIPRASAGGDWNVWAAFVDRARLSYQVHYAGPDAYRNRPGGGSNPDWHVLPFPGGRGRFGVVGRRDSGPA
jgi:hypothetical protein